MVTVSLPDDVEAWARAEVAAGRASSIEEFVAHALREQQASVSELRALLDEGRADIAAGRVIAGEVVIQDLRTRIARLRAQD